MRGRTWRRRNKKKRITPSVSLDNDLSIINLKNWMKSKTWCNFSLLKLKAFPTTSRGLCSSLKIKPNDTLIKIPYELLITATTLDLAELNEIVLVNQRKNLKIQDALALFLVIERHKGELSEWHSYINSLPKLNPPVSWLCTSLELKFLPTSMKSAVKQKLDLFEESWGVSSKVVDPKWMCSCCRTLGSDLFTKSVFNWAYTMVNTRSIYVDPSVVRELSENCVSGFAFSLADEPSMALCPFLDMFNHSNGVGTQTKLEEVNNKWVFSLVSLTPFERDEEIFISYGNHDNMKLLLEYGFFIPNDDLNVITIIFQEILNVTKVEINERQYKFLKGKQLDQNLTITTVGLSFNLKAVLFVVLNPCTLDWCTCIFNDEYGREDLVKMWDLAKVMIHFQTVNLRNTLSALRADVQSPSESMVTAVSYLEYNLGFMERLQDGHNIVLYDNN